MILAPIAQSGLERFPVKEEVAGSNPVRGAWEIKMIRQGNTPSLRRASIKTLRVDLVGEVSRQVQKLSIQRPASQLLH